MASVQVTACLRIVALHGEKRFLKYHRVLSRAVWSSLAFGPHNWSLFLRAAQDEQEQQRDAWSTAAATQKIKSALQRTQIGQ